MNDIIIPDEKRRLDFAFIRFWGLKYPVFVKSRIYTSAHHNGLHNHDFPQIWYCLDGSYLHQVEEHVYECAKGSVVVIPTGVFHKFRIPEGEKAEILSLNIMYDVFLNTPIHKYINTIAALFLPSFFRDSGYIRPTFLTLSRKSQTALEECTSWLTLSNFNPPGSVSEVDILEKIEAIFSLPELALPEEHLQAAIELIKNRLFPMMRMLSYMNIHYSEKISDDDFLRTLGICRANWYRYFKCYTGYTCSQYLQLLRIKHVHIYVSHTNYPLTYISDVCGICNTQHMSRAFKKYTGWSPRQYRIYKKKWLEENPQHKLHIL